MILSVIVSLILLISYVSFGVYVLTRSNMAAISRGERIALAVLVGSCLQSFLALLLLMAGLNVTPALVLSIVLPALYLLIAFRRVGMTETVSASASFLTRVSDDDKHIDSFSIMKVFILLGAAALVLWTAGAAFFLPTTDYDGLAIWSYRTRVLVAEGTLYTESLRDPMRLINQPLHPYLLPVMEATWCKVLGGFSWSASHIPHLLIYLCYLGISWGFYGATAATPREWITTASLMLMPCMGVGLSMVSAREPIMAVFAAVSMLMLILWDREGHGEYLALSAFFALMMQQTKIEGLPFAVGWGMAALGLAMVSRGALQVRHVIVSGVALVLLALPWAIVRLGIPPAHIDPFMADYTSILKFPVHHVPQVLWLMMSEIFFRPELYGLAGFAAVGFAATGWRDTHAVRRLLLMFPVILYLAAIAAIYSLRQDQLSADRNASISRRMICIMPAFVIAAGARPRKRTDKTQPAVPT